MACSISLGGGSPSTPNKPQNPIDPSMDMDIGKTAPRDSSILTLEPYNPKPRPSGNLPGGKQKNPTLSWKRATLEELFSPSKWSQYITFIGNLENMPSDFVIYRSLKSLLDTENVNFSVDKNKITVKAETEAQSKLLLQTSKIGNEEFMPTDKTHYNTRSATMLLDKLRLGKEETDGFIADAIKEILTDQHHKVNDVQIYEKLSFKSKQKIKLARITFGQQTIPFFMKIGNKKIYMKEEIPKPFHCRKCLRFGHTKKYCKEEVALCYRCGQHEHTEECMEPLSCFNCRESHHAFSWDCRYFKYNQEALVRSLKYGITIRDAKQDMKEEGRNLYSTPYASVARPSHDNKKHQSLQAEANKIIPTSNRFAGLSEVGETGVAPESPKSSPILPDRSTRPKTGTIAVKLKK